ncbi:MAG: hypothetical protein Tsb0020_33680 [Haliangiales bacterium]
MRLRCDLVEQLSEGDALWQEWQALMAKVRPGMGIFGPHWYNAWRETLGSAGRWTGCPMLVTARDEAGALVGVLPLGEQQYGPMSVFSIGGDWQPARSIVAAAAREHEIGHALGKFVAATDWLGLRMAPCMQSAPVMQGFTAALGESRVYHRVQLHEPIAMYRAETTWDDYVTEVLGKKFNKKITYYENRLGRAGKLDIVHVRRPSADETERLIADLGAIERRSWLGQSEDGYLRFAPALNAAMWRRLIVDALSPADQIDAWVLYLDGAPVSFCFTLTDGDVRYVIANNYDQAVRTHRTGSTLYRRMMRDGIERGVTQFDFGGSEIHYKSRWGASYQDASQTMLLVPNTLVSGAAKPMTRLYAQAAPQLSMIARHPHVAALARHPRLAPLVRHPRLAPLIRGLSLGRNLIQAAQQHSAAIS